VVLHIIKSLQTSGKLIILFIAHGGKLQLVLINVLIRFHKVVM